MSTMRLGMTLALAGLAIAVCLALVIRQWVVVVGAGELGRADYWCRGKDEA